MDVKQPEPKPAPQPTLQQQTEDTAAKAAETISTAKEEVKQEVEKQVAEAAPAGATVYATCVGCHGAKGEGGMGPNLSSQTPADIVAKLKKYKAGEQMGPMTGVMAPMAAGLSEEDMQAVAEYVVTLK
ncbi:c-type cytochrome [Thiomicrorhabdus sp. HH1]|uniref:C-type cytochrome n=2 Tax=Piscirickettsiaceae TaxID=135616 RepID=A0ABS0BZF8_9GAMM|nr:c-type cytochrome [Thiomicrorhabdus heinhorstiae]